MNNENMKSVNIDNIKGYNNNILTYPMGDGFLRTHLKSMEDITIRFYSCIKPMVDDIYVLFEKDCVYEVYISNYSIKILINGYFYYISRDLLLHYNFIITNDNGVSIPTYVPSYHINKILNNIEYDIKIYNNILKYSILDKEYYIKSDTVDRIINLIKSKDIYEGKTILIKPKFDFSIRICNYDLLIFEKDNIYELYDNGSGIAIRDYYREINNHYDYIMESSDIIDEASGHISNINILRGHNFYCFGDNDWDFDHILELLDIKSFNEDKIYSFYFEVTSEETNIWGCIEFDKYHLDLYDPECRNIVSGRVLNLLLKEIKGEN